MIRNGMPRKLAAQVARTQLLERWQVYPQPVRRPLVALLQRYGLEAARLATEALESSTADMLEAKKGNSDATPAS